MSPEESTNPGIPRNDLKRLGSELNHSLPLEAGLPSGLADLVLRLVVQESETERERLDRRSSSDQPSS